MRDVSSKKRVVPQSCRGLSLFIVREEPQCSGYELEKELLPCSSINQVYRCHGCFELPFGVSCFATTKDVVAKADKGMWGMQNTKEFLL